MSLIIEKHGSHDAVGRCFRSIPILLWLLGVSRLRPKARALGIDFQPVSNLAAKPEAIRVVVYHIGRLRAVVTRENLNL
jgi:hypothetical protein